MMALVAPTVLAKPPRIEDRIRGRAIAAASPPMESPAVRSVAAATHMKDEDLVFGVTVSGESRAYPWWVAKNFHVVDDVLGGEPVALAFCEQCSGAAAFKEAGLAPTDMKYVSLYDSFTITVIVQLEDLGFCAKGAGGRFVADGTLICGTGSLPFNTDGGGSANIQYSSDAVDKAKAVGGHTIKGVREI